MSAVIFKGANRLQDDSFTGKTVMEILNDRTVCSALGIATDDNVRINGDQVDTNAVVGHDDRLEFYKSSGAKGA